MALYRCPKCGYVVRKEAKRCSTCGLWFDRDHEPVPDEDDADSIKLSKKEKRTLIIAAVVVFVILVIVVFVAVGNARLFVENFHRWERRPKRIISQWFSWG